MGKWEYHQAQLGLGLKQGSLGGTFYHNVRAKIINIYRKQQQINSDSLSTGEGRVVLAVGELERVPCADSNFTSAVFPYYS